MNSPLRTLRKLLFFAHREQSNRDLEEEMAFHRQQAERELIADGLSPAEAHDTVARRFGNEAHLRDQSAQITGLWFETVLQDLRFALRQLRRSPGFAATAILILTLGIGAAVAIFSFVDAALIRPLPYQNPSRLVVLYESIPLGPRFHLSYPDYIDWKRLNTVFSSLDVYEISGFILQTPAGSQQVDGAHVSAGFFRTLGVTPFLGRDLEPRDEQPNQPRTALLSYSAWQRRFGARRDILGQSVTLDNNLVTIVGVLPRTFHFAPRSRPTSGPSSVPPADVRRTAAATISSASPASNPASASTPHSPTSAASPATCPSSTRIPTATRRHSCSP